MLMLTTVAFGLAWWLGWYLIARGPTKPLLLRVGFGLLSYALALAIDLLRNQSFDPALTAALSQLSSFLVFLPAIGWTGAAILLLPEGWPPRSRIDAIWRNLLAPLTIVMLVAVALLDGGSVAWLFWALCGFVLLPLLILLVLAVIQRRRLRPAPVAGLLIAATLFFGLSVALILLPLQQPRDLLMLGMGFDMALLGVAVAIFDAFDEGEALRYDLLRSLIGAIGAASLFGGQVTLVLLIAGEVTLPLIVLLLGVVAAAITIQIFASPLQSLLDRLAFAHAPQLRQARADLQAESAALPRVHVGIEFATLDAAEFVRYTRRALSHYGDLARLASSPLTRLPMIEQRLALRGAPDNPIERATELKALLAERIVRLKPRNGEFGTSDEWRHYNALYFPYVVGIKPYSRRNDGYDSEPIAQRALEWLAVQVPERTLYNWQNAAAKLIAADLQTECQDLMREPVTR